MCCDNTADAAKLVIKTFDFWFCVYNLIVFEIAIFGINHLWKTELGLFLFWQFANVVDLMSVFLIDTYFLSFDVRVFISTIKIALWMYWCVIRFLYWSDTAFTWNPFKFLNHKETVVNWKFVYIASVTNVMLIIAKPMVGYLVVKLIKKFKNSRRRKKKKKKKKIQNLNTTPSFTIRQKRPHIVWN